MEKDSKKTTRKRKGPPKIWLPNEENALIDFLKEHTNFEKPSGQVYYKEFLEKSKIDVQWQLVRSKVHNMRTKYNKAKAFENSTGAGALKENETMKDVLTNMCSFFEDFDEIFNNRDDENVVTYESLLFEDEPTTHVEEYVHDLTSDVVTPFCSTPKTPAPPSRKGIYSRTALSEIIESHEEVLKFKKQKMDMEEKFKIADVELQREKFEFEKSKVQQKMELRLKEIESNERIKALEIEMKAKVALKELELKTRQNIF